MVEFLPLPGSVQQKTKELGPGGPELGGGGSAHIGSRDSRTVKGSRGKTNVGQKRKTLGQNNSVKRHVRTVDELNRPPSKRLKKCMNESDTEVRKPSRQLTQKTTEKGKVKGVPTKIISGDKKRVEGQDTKSSTNTDEVSIVSVLTEVVNTVQNFKGGKIKDYVQTWSTITSDVGILETVQGLKIDTGGLPRCKTGRLQYKFTPPEVEGISKEIDKLKSVGILVETGREKGDWVSPIFARPKQDGSLRLVINLKGLNKHLDKIHFKMDTLKTAIQLVKKGCFFGSVDLKDAYYSVPVAPESQKLLKIQWQGELLQFTSMPNGLSPAPRIFTKLMKPPLSSIRKQGHTILGYLDDFLLIGDTREECASNVETTVTLFDDLGFTVHPEKSNITPCQEVEFLGFILDSKQMIVKPTQAKIQKIMTLCGKIQKRNKITIRELAEVIGKLVALEQGVSGGSIFIKRMEIDRNEALKESDGDYDAEMTVSKETKMDLQWWIDNLPGGKREIIIPDPSVVITSDASTKGWGGEFQGETSGGLWTAAERKLHINCLELKACGLVLKSFCRDLRATHVRIRTDNTTVVACINKLGSCKKTCNAIAREILLWGRERGLTLSAEHLPGKENEAADRESRQARVDTEWKLREEVFKKVIQKLGECDTDLFASRSNKQLTRYVAWRPDPGAWKIDAFLLSWTNINGYVFPPFSLYPGVLAKVERDEAEVTLIAPIWTTQPWFTKLLRLLVANPIILPKNTIINPHNSELEHPIKDLRLMACRLSGKRSKNKAYRKTLQAISWHPKDKAQWCNIAHISRSGSTLALNGKEIHMSFI